MEYLALGEKQKAVLLFLGKNKYFSDIERLSRALPETDRVNLSGARYVELISEFGIKRNSERTDLVERLHKLEELGLILRLTSRNCARILDGRRKEFVLSKRGAEEFHKLTFHEYNSAVRNWEI